MNVFFVSQGLQKLVFRYHASSLEEVKKRNGDVSQPHSYFWSCRMGQRRWTIVRRELQMWVLMFAKRTWKKFLVLQIWWRIIRIILNNCLS